MQIIKAAGDNNVVDFIEHKKSAVDQAFGCLGLFVEPHSQSVLYNDLTEPG